MKTTHACMLATAMLPILPADAWRGCSPDGRLSIDVDNGRCTLFCQQQQVLQLMVGCTSTAKGHPQVQPVSTDYTMLTGKRHHCTNEANEYKDGDITFRLYNDGLAFRYNEPCDTLTAYIIPEGTRRWMQQWTDSYEGFFPLTTTYKVAAVPSYSGTFKTAQGWCNRWGYPALIEPADGIFALITEANIARGQSASCLYNDGEVYRVVPDKRETNTQRRPAKTPWRVVITGTLADVVQSTLVTDVSEPSQITDDSWIKPGSVAWVYWAYNHGSNDYNIIAQYVDLAATLRLPYVLIDAEWDEMKDGHSVEDAIGYAKQKGVKPMIWYNSSVGWVNGAPGPKYRLNKPEDREREFAWCERLGVVGVKIDFFSGDTQLNMDYCLDLLQSAARHHLLVNFHGATIPRGWQRTWPNLMSTEGVYGAEWYNNVPTFTTQAARHNATLPFTRNVVGPMDYTPCTFSDSQHRHITTHAHELALTVLFESGLQHLPDRPDSYLAQPQQVRQFLTQLPTVWDDTRLLDGYPGEYAVMARRSGNTWYIAGINGTDKEMAMQQASHFIGTHGHVEIFQDNGERAWALAQTDSIPSHITCQPRGGFVIVVHPYGT